MVTLRMDMSFKGSRGRKGSEPLALTALSNASQPTASAELSLSFTTAPNGAVDDES